MAFSPKHFVHLVGYFVTWPIMAVATVVWALRENPVPAPSPVVPQEWH